MKGLKDIIGIDYGKLQDELHKEMSESEQNTRERQEQAYMDEARRNAREFDLPTRERTLKDDFAQGFGAFEPARRQLRKDEQVAENLSTDYMPYVGSKDVAQAANAFDLPEMQRNYAISPTRHVGIERSQDFTVDEKQRREVERPTHKSSEYAEVRAVRPGERGDDGRIFRRTLGGIMPEARHDTFGFAKIAKSRRDNQAERLANNFNSLLEDAMSFEPGNYNTDQYRAKSDTIAAAEGNLRELVRRERDYDDKLYSFFDTDEGKRVARPILDKYSDDKAREAAKMYDIDEDTAVQRVTAEREKRLQEAFEGSDYYQKWLFGTQYGQAYNALNKAQRLNAAKYLDVDTSKQQKDVDNMNLALSIDESKDYYKQELDRLEKEATEKDIKEGWVDENTRRYMLSGGRLSPINMPSENQKTLEAAARAYNDIAETQAEYLREGNTTALGRFFRGAGNAATDKRTWDFGFSHLNDAVELEKAAQAVEQGKATKAQELLVNLSALKNVVTSEYGDVLGGMYGAGRTTTEMLPFMLQMIMTPTTGVIRAATGKIAGVLAKKMGKEAAEKAARFFAEKLTGKVIKTIGKGVQKVAEATERGTVAQTLYGMPTTLADTQERMTGMIKAGTSDDGKIVYTGREKGDGLIDAARKSYIANNLEYTTEMLGSLFRPATQAMKRGVKAFTDYATKNGINLSKIYDFFAMTDKKGMVQIWDKFAKKGFYDGPVGEYGEEVINNLGNALLVGDLNFNSPDDPNSVFNPKLNFDTFLAVAMGSAFMGGLGRINYGATILQKRAADHRLNAKLENWDRLKDELASKATANDALKEGLERIAYYEKNGSVSHNEAESLKKSLADYAQITWWQKGLDMREEKEQEAAEDTQADNTGTTAQDAATVDVVTAGQGEAVNAGQQPVQSPTDVLTSVNTESMPSAGEAVDVDPGREYRSAGRDFAAAEAELDDRENSNDHNKAAAAQIIKSSSDLFTAQAILNERALDTEDNLALAERYFSSLERSKALEDEMLARANEETDNIIHKDTDSVVEVTDRDGNAGYVISGGVSVEDDGTVSATDDTVMVKSADGTVRQIPAVELQFTTPATSRDDYAHRLQARMQVRNDVPEPVAGIAFTDDDGIRHTVTGVDTAGNIVVSDDLGETTTISRDDYNYFMSNALDKQEEQAQAAGQAEVQPQESQPVAGPVTAGQPQNVEHSSTDAQGTGKNVPAVEKNVENIQQEAPQEVDEVSKEERSEMENRIVDWLSEDNLSKAYGKTREEIFNEFGNELEPIAYIPAQFISLVDPELTDTRIYCGKGYFIDHALRNHAGSGRRIAPEDVDVSKYLNMQYVLDNPDSIKETVSDGKRTVVFIKKIGRYFAELTQVEENGKIVLHKSLFNQKKEPYAKLDDIRSKQTSPEGGVSSISHADNAAPAISLESRDDVNRATSAGKDNEKPEEIPTDGKGNLLYSEVPVEKTVAYLYNSGLTDEEIQGFIEANIAASREKYERLAQKQPKIGTDIAKYKAKKAQWRSSVDGAKKQYDYWQAVDTYIKEQTHTTEEEVSAARAELEGDNARREYASISGDIQGDAVVTAVQFISDKKITPESFRRETGYGKDEQRRFVGMIASKEKGGESIERLAERLAEDDADNNNGALYHGDDYNAKSAILEALQRYGTRGALKKGEDDMLADKYAEEKSEERDAHYMDAYHMDYADYLAAREQEMPDIWRKYGNFDKDEYYSLYAEEIEQRLKGIENEQRTDSEREEPADDRSDKVLPGERLDDGGGIAESAEPERKGDNGNGSPVPHGYVQEGSSAGEVAEKIAQAEAETDTNPTEAQKEAGNYKKGHVRIDGFDITIENPKGSVRSGVDANGKRWENTMNNTYGYMRGTEGVDGDHIDVFLSDNPEEGNVYVVDQQNPETGEFDEHKVMYGFNSMEEAKEAYLANYTPGWKGLGTITEVSKDEFKRWINSSHRKTKPFAEYKSVNKTAGQGEANEAAIRDAVVERLRESGIDVITDTEAGQRVLDEANGKQKISLETDSVPEEEHLRTVISSDSGAKVLKNIDNLINEYENSSYTKEKTFIGNIAKALSARQYGSGSEYATFETVNGKIVTIRLANHSASSKRMDNAGRDNAISIVISSKPNTGVFNDGKAHIVEFYYNAMKLRRAGGKPLVEILKSIKQALYSGEYKDTTGLAEVQEVNGDTIREHRVYHGSGADFEAFDHSHMGEGEGAQAYGWGSYVTEVEGIGRTYAEERRISETDVDDELATRMADYEADSDSVSEPDYATREHFGIDEPVFLEDGYSVGDADEAKLARQAAIYYGRDIDLENEEDVEEIIDELLGDMTGYYNEEYARRRNEYESNLREELEARQTVHLYTVEIPDDTGENYLDWEKGPTEKQGELIRKALLAELDSRGMRSEENIAGLERQWKLAYEADGRIGGAIYYNIIRRVAGSDKAASELLSKIGFTGISYPAQATTGGRADGARNYVIFDEKDLKITDHVRFFRTENGEAYGFTAGGKIYLDPRMATVETPIHEYSHLWASVLREANPNEWKHIAELLKGTPVWDEVKRRYPELETDDEIADEVLATYSGRRGAERLRDEARKIAEGKGSPIDKAEAVSALRRVREALQRFWKGVADFLHIHYASAEDVADRVMRDLAEGVNPQKSPKGNMQNPAVEKIEDVGEKIGGARKDRFAEYMEKSKQVEDKPESFMEQLRKLPVSKMFNFPLDALRKDGLSNEAATLIDIIRRMIPAKPRSEWKLKRWTENVFRLYRMCLTLGTADKKMLDDILERIQRERIISGMYRAQMALGGFDSGKDTGTARLEQLGDNAGHYDKNGEWVSAKGQWYVSHAGRYGGIYPDFEKAKEVLEKFAGENTKTSGSKKDVQFSVYMSNADKSCFITVKGKPDMVVQSGFKTAKDATNYLNEHIDDLREKYRNFKESTNIGFRPNGERIGKDWRGGKDVAAEDFRKAFGFRGVEFGNWTNQKERQSALNQAYDAFMDLSEATGISPQGLSLGGELGIAFGARGGGKAAAHYESGKVVINLTKTQGAGTLAHEWWHAIDNYFSRRRGHSAGYNTERRDYKLTREEGKLKRTDEKERTEITDAFGELMKAIEESDYGKRSNRYASIKSNYWKDPTVLGARAFAVWVERKLSEKGIVDDFLANNNTLGWDTPELTQKYFPYPMESDFESLDTAFDNLFNAIEEKTDEETGNTILYRFIGEKGAARLDAAEEATKRLDNLAVARQMEAAYNEKKARIEKLRRSKPVKITGEEYKGKYELNRDSAKQWIKDNLRGEYVNKDTGEKIEIRKDGAQKVTSHSMGNEAHLKSLAAIPQMIENSIFIDELPNEKTNGKYDSYRYYVCGLKIGGVDYTAKITVGVKGASKYYDHALTEIEKGNLLDNIDALSTTFVNNEIANGFKPTGDAPVPSYSKGKDKRLVSILQTNDDENARKIKVATGWERGADGKWRYETPDIKYRPVKNIEEGKFYQLSDLVNDKDLFNAYPELKSVNVVFRYEPAYDYGGYWDIREKLILINTAYTTSRHYESVLVHEIQHAIQYIERFAHGGSKSLAYEYYIKKDGEYLGDFNKRELNELYELRRMAERLVDEGQYKRIGNAINHILKTAKENGYYPKWVVDDYDKTPYYVLQDYTSAELEKARDLDEDKFYMSISGEVEARNAEERMGMSEDERRNTLAKETEDVAREDQIFLETTLRGNSKAQMQSESADLQETNERFNEELDKWENGDMTANKYINVGSPKGTLQYFMPKLPIILRQKVLSKSKKKHGLSATDMRDLPVALAYPIFVFKRGNDSISVLTELENSKGENVFVAIELDAQKQMGHQILNVNDILTIHGREIENVISPIIENQSLVWVNKEKGLNWLSSAKSKSQAITNEVLDSAANIVKNFNNPEGSGGNLREGVAEYAAENSPEAVARRNAERKERITGRVRAFAEENGLGDIDIIESADDARVPDRVRREIESGSVVSGWYDTRTGRVALYYPTVTDEADALRTVAHEAIGHKGLRAVIGEDTYNEFLDYVDKNADNDIAERINAKESETGNRRVAVDEVLAEIAEREAGEPVHLNLWQRIAGWIRDALRRIGIDTEITVGQAQYYIWRSRRNAGEGGLTDTARDTVMRRKTKAKDVLNISAGMRTAAESEAETLQEVNKRFNEELSGLTEENAQSKILYLGNPGKILLAAGISDKPIKLYGNKLLKKMHKHDFTIAAVKNLPIEINNPIAVFKGSVENSFAILSELKINGNNVLASLTIGKGNDIEFNIISSIYGKDSNSVVFWINRGKTLYVNKEKALNYLRISAPIAEAQDNQELDSAANIINNFENPETGEENIRFRKSPRQRAIEAADNAVRTYRESAADLYHNTLERSMFRFTEAFQDGMRSVRVLVDSILTSRGESINELKEYEDAYRAENHCASKSMNEFDQYRNRLYNPVIEAARRVMETSGLDTDGLRHYLFAKSGLERNREFTVRDIYKIADKANDEAQRRYATAKRKVEEAKASDEWKTLTGEEKKELELTTSNAEKRADEKKAALDATEAIVNEYRELEERMYLELENGDIGFEEYCDTLDEFVTKRIDKDYDPAKTDYSGFASIFKGEKDYKQAALALVRSIEGDRARRSTAGVNDAFNEALGKLTEENADGVTLMLGRPSEVLRAAGVEDKPMKLYGNKVIKKMKKHGFALAELKNLPEAVANPIAVFDNYQKEGNRSILTELKTSNGNFLVIIDLGKDADVDFNIVTSVFGKGNNNVVDWINKGYATYINKEKAQEFLSHQSALIAATAANSELDSAANIVENFENPKFEADETGIMAERACNDLWKKIKTATDYLLSKQAEGGLISHSQADMLKKRSNWYVPMRGWNGITTADVYDYVNNWNKTQGRRKEKEAGGRGSEAGDPIAQIIYIAQNTIEEANRNEVKQRFLDFVLNHMSDLATVHPAWVRLNEKGEWEYAAPDIEEGDSAEQIEQKIKNFEANMQAEKEAGRASKINSKARLNVNMVVIPRTEDEHTVLVRRGGRMFTIIINGNPRAAQALNGWLQRQQQGDVARVFNRAMRGIAMLITSKAPNFILRNGMRDFGYAADTLMVREGKDYAARFLKNYAAIIPAREHSIFKLLEKFKEGMLDTEHDDVERMFSEFMLNGAETGYINYQNVEKWRSDIENLLKKDPKGITEKGKKNLKKAWKGTWEYIEKLNRGAEDLVRFATYMTSRQEGRSIFTSVDNAKNVSVNFNRSGAGYNGQGWWRYPAGFMRGWFMFFNAGVQGLTNFLYNFKAAPGRSTARAIARGIAGSIVPYFTLGFLNGLLHGLYGGDDGDDDGKDGYFDLTDYTRRTNFIIGGFGDYYIMLPLPIELRAFYGAGEAFAGVLTGKQHAEDVALSAVASLFELLPVNPVEMYKNPANLAGGVFSPIAQAVMNKNFMGVPLYKDTPWNEEAPAYTKAYAGTPKILVDISRSINELTGGNEYKTGWLGKTDNVINNPAITYHLLRSYLGGVAQVFGQVFNLMGDYIVPNAETAITGEGEYNTDRIFREIPFFSVLVTQNDERTGYSLTNKLYHDMKEQADRRKDLLGKYFADGNKQEEINEMLEDSKANAKDDVILFYDGILKDLNEQAKGSTEEESEQIKITINKVRKAAVLNASEAAGEPLTLNMPQTRLQEQLGTGEAYIAEHMTIPDALEEGELRRLKSQASKNPNTTKNKITLTIIRRYESFKRKMSDAMEYSDDMGYNLNTIREARKGMLEYLRGM